MAWQTAQTQAVLVQLRFHHEWRRQRRNHPEHGACTRRQAADNDVAARPHNRVQVHIAAGHQTDTSPLGRLRLAVVGRIAATATSHIAITIGTIDGVRTVELLLIVERLAGPVMLVVRHQIEQLEMGGESLFHVPDGGALTGHGQLAVLFQNSGRVPQTQIS